MRSYSMPLHGTLLPRDDRAGTRPWLGCDFGRDLLVDCVGRHHCRRRQAHLVGDRAGMGKILVDTEPCSFHAQRLLLALLSRPSMSAARPLSGVMRTLSGHREMTESEVVDGARSRHRSAIEWFVGDESHEGSRPHANYHDRFGYR